MELIILGPVTMAMGAILVHMSLDHQRRSRATLAAIEIAESGLEIDEASDGEDVASIGAAQPPAANLTTADVLLADTLTELLGVKQQLASLQSKVEALTAAPQPSRQLELAAYQH
jgi:hypothetical protein